MRALKTAVAHISRWSPQLDQVRRTEQVRTGAVGDLLETRPVREGKEDGRERC
jgi:hypothetical protein